MVRAAGADVVSSAELVTRFYATWTDDELATHRRTAEKVADIAQRALRHAGAEAHAGRPMTEHGLQQHILAQFGKASLETIEPPVVAVGPNAANPHYEPRADKPVSIRQGDLVLLDNLEILFDTGLEIEPLRLLQVSSRNRTAVCRIASMRP